MSKKVFLGSNRSKRSVNTTNFLQTDLDRKDKVLQGSNIVSDYSLLDTYNAERDACDKFRMIFVVNPICSNVLFNMRTEVVYKEGGDETQVLGDSTGVNKTDIPNNAIQNTTDIITRKQAIKDTEYSHPRNGDFKYHCGVDIFNNHLLRKKEFMHINKMKNTDKCGAVFNTIRDYIRDNEGNVVTSVIRQDSTTAATDLHIYTADNLMTIKDAFTEHIEDIDGWIGFTNPGTINIVNQDNKNVLINRLINNEKPCAFIDMYPGRQLYSFVPQYNEARQRSERNWDYCITYPYRKDSFMIDYIFNSVGGAIKADVQSGVTPSSVQILMCRSLFKHTLSANSQISLYYWDASDDFKKYPKMVRVLNVGNFENSEGDRFFSIRKSDIGNDVWDRVLNNGSIYYKKISNGTECEYYFREYKKLKLPDGNVPKSEINKLAYGENIYGDRMAQIIYTDDIDVEGLHDHLGRPLTELYLTIVKRNAGYKEWSAGTYNSPAVEISHCFGRNTAAVDFGTYSGAQKDYNIHFIHNVECPRAEAATRFLPVFGNIWKRVRRGDFWWYLPPYSLPQSSELEDGDITIDNDTFWGDVVEMDTYAYEEHVISNVMFRFNTLQRESDIEKAVFYEKLVHDDYDAAVGGGNFLVEESQVFNEAEINGEMISIPSSICPEGYFYNPHNRIKIRETSPTTVTAKAKWVNYKFLNSRVEDGNTVMNIKVPVDYGYVNGDYIAFYFAGGVDTRYSTYKDPTLVWGMVRSKNEYDIELMFEGQPFGEDCSDLQVFTFRAYYSTISVPLYAKFHEPTRSFVWRGIVPASEMNKDMELYDTPFSNGRFYVEKNINFFLRRQDPHGDFGLSKAKFLQGQDRYNNPNEFFRLSGERLDLSQVYNFYNKTNYICY